MRIGVRNDEQFELIPGFYSEISFAFSMRMLTEKHWGVNDLGAITLSLSHGFLLNFERNEFLCEIAGETSLFDLLTGWCSENALELLERLFDKNTGAIAGTVMILLNGRSVKSDDPKTLMVSPGDNMTIFPILVGG